MSKLTKALTAAAGNAGGDNLYVEDVFSTYLYDGSGAARTIANGIPLSDEGGLVWLKNRALDSHVLFDTVNGPQKSLASNDTAAGANYSSYLSFPSAGTAGWDLAGAVLNGTGTSWASWTFRKAEKFFDIVTYTGDGVDNRQIPHNLGSVPGMIIVKSTSSGGQWPVYHQSLGTGAVRLNLTNSYNSANIWWKTTPTDSHFTVYGGGEVNVSGIEYVAYLFASDAGGFGDDGSENIIKCGSVTTDGSGDATVTLGFEPQWVMLKRTDGAGTWAILDTMRGYDHSSSKRLQPNTSDAEENYTGTNILGVPTATGFTTSGPVLDANSDYIYIAIRRPMKTPESGTEVFQSLAYTGDGASTRNFDLNLTLDAYFQACRSSASYDFKNFTSRLTGKGLYTAGTGAEFITNTSLDVQDGLRAIGFENTLNQSGQTYIINGLKRATGFMDAVAYSGSGSATTQAHNLGVVPEMMWIKRRDNSGNWMVYGATPNPEQKYLAINLTDAADTASWSWNNTSPTATNFALGTGSVVNGSGGTFIAYLFATLAGVSKVGSYTGTGSDLNVDCGFSAGARFILIKRTDSSGGWHVWDSSRGISASTDPYLLLNSTAAEVTNTDYVDPLSSGFTVTSSAPAALNASGGTYIFLAIA